MLLENKNAVIYGAGGYIGGAVAREFAREGVRLFVTGRTREKLEAVTSEITAEGGSAEVVVLDALDEQAVGEHALAVVSQAGGIDVSFNLITQGDVQTIPLFQMKTEDFVQPVINGIISNFATTGTLVNVTSGMFPS